LKEGEVKANENNPSRHDNFIGLHSCISSFDLYLPRLPSFIGDHFIATNKPLGLFA
jgi:hypothetical protein